MWRTRSDPPEKSGLSPRGHSASILAAAAIPLDLLQLRKGTIAIVAGIFYGEMYVMCIYPKVSMFHQSKAINLFNVKCPSWDQPTSRCVSGKHCEGFHKQLRSGSATASNIRNPLPVTLQQPSKK